MIYIIRHGQTKLNKKQVLQGRVEEPLNETGIKQSFDAKAELEKRGIKIDRIYSSPLGRAIQTGQIVAGYDVPMEKDDRLLEMDYGPYEGADLNNPPPEIVEFFSDFEHNPPPYGMEHLEDVVSRAGEFLEYLKKQDIEGKNILISTHAIAMKGVLEYLTPESKGSYWAKHIANCEIYETELVDGDYKVPKPALE